MLQELIIKHFALIDTLEMQLDTGTTILSGETGAGKSIILGAIQLALGARASSDLIKPDCDQAEICLTFDISRHTNIQTWLKTHDLSAEETCILRRIISRSGKSKCYINGYPTTLQQCRELSQQLVSIHGQHDNQCLMQRDEQTAIVDAFAGNETLLETIQTTVKSWKEKTTQLNTLKNSLTDSQQREAFLQFQIEEFTQANLTEEEITSLPTEHKRLAYSEQLLHHYQQAMDMLESDNDLSSQLQRLEQVLMQAEKHDPEIKPCIDLAEQASIAIQEMQSEIQQRLDHIDCDPQSLQRIEERMRIMHDLARKHRVKPENLIELYQSMQTELEAITHADASLEALETNIKALEKSYLIDAKKLTKQRQAVAKKLAQSITEVIRTLGMPHATFSIESLAYDDQTPRFTGQELMEFHIQTNPGQPAKPLAKTASGGELARVSLAIQMKVAEHVALPTLFFDEIDTGIGGPTAARVGQCLRALGNNHQVICITHQPQVASQAHHHWQVKKDSDGKKTEITILPLNENARIEELARMLGGVQITDSARKHAQDLLAESI
ncbi:MAG: DNA repair protein RecN [Gammaproteobacteria bacterium]